jgi:hypothetical protein
MILTPWCTTPLRTLWSMTIDPWTTHSCNYLCFFSVRVEAQCRNFYRSRLLDDDLGTISISEEMESMCKTPTKSPRTTRDFMMQLGHSPLRTPIKEEPYSPSQILNRFQSPLSFDLGLGGTSPVAMSTPVRRDEEANASLCTPQPPTSREHLTPKKINAVFSHTSPRTPPSFKKVLANFKGHAVSNLQLKLSLHEACVSLQIHHVFGTTKHAK